MKSRLCAFVFFAGLSTAALGQSMLGLTYPFGLPVQPNSGMSSTMGGAGCAVAADYNVMLLNPANLATIDKTVLSALFSFDFSRVGEGAAHANFYAANPLQVSIGVPFGIVGTIGLSFDVRSDRTAFYKDSSSLVYNGDPSWWFSQGLSSRGGIQVWQIGWGRSLGKYVQLGLSYERFNLLYEQTEVSQLTIPLVQLSSSRDSTTVNGSGNGIRAGVVVPAGRLRIGASGEYFFTNAVTASEAVYANNLDTAVVNTSSSSSFNLRLPPSLTAGLSYDISPEWLVAGDVSFVFWRYANIVEPLSLADAAVATGLSLGGQYIPSPNTLAPKYWETIRYRAGLRFTQLPSRDSYEYALTLGTGLPMGKGLGVFDVALDLGRRQSGQFSGYSEDFMHLVVGINGGHKWVQSTRSTY